MRLDAREGHTNYFVYDTKSCREVREAVWVDDTLAQWGRYLPYNGVTGLLTEAVQEDRVTIYMEKHLVIFNEVDEETPDTVLELASELANTELTGRHEPNSPAA